MAAKKKVDYAQLEPSWRAGIKTPREMSADYLAANGAKVSHQAIIKHFTKLGISRDLGAKIKASAQAKVDRAMVDNKVDKATTPKEAEIIEANATIVADIQLSHRKDIKRNRELSIKMLEELEATTDNRELFEQLGELMRAPDDKGQDKRNDIYRKILELPSRVDSFKKLTETLKTLVALEREAYNIGLSATGLTPEQEALKGLFDHMAQNKPSLLPE